MNELQIFENSEFGTVRTVEIEGKTYFVANDVARALGYKRPNDAITAHCRGTLKHRIGVQTGVRGDGLTKQTFLVNALTSGKMERITA